MSLVTKHRRGNMKWIHIDKEKCNECGFCASVCFPCFSRENNTVQCDSEELCIQCGHCIAVCPADAIVHKKMDMDAFKQLDVKGKLETQAFISFLQRRRSYRNFREKEVPRRILETLIDVCRYAPTGSNNQKVEIMVIQNKKKIRKLSDMTASYFTNILSSQRDRANKLRAVGKEAGAEHDALVQSLKKKRVEKRLSFEIDPIFHEAPTVIIFHSNPETGTPKDNCVLAAHSMALTALTMGLGTCYIGLFEIAANNHPLVEEELNLPTGNKVYSVLILGYPKYNFIKTVYRNPINVIWE
jgi:nitroreductase/NAD-dependent dihydropyrimidine dehydrogenase PreA subunit